VLRDNKQRHVSAEEQLRKLQAQHAELRKAYTDKSKQVRGPGAPAAGASGRRSPVQGNRAAVQAAAASALRGPAHSAAAAAAASPARRWRRLSART
jgi:hypothetical protein